jgi:hypothetical protein
MTAFLKVETEIIPLVSGCFKEGFSFDFEVM